MKLPAAADARFLAGECLLCGVRLDDVSLAGGYELCGEVSRHRGPGADPVTGPTVTVPGPCGPLTATVDPDGTATVRESWSGIQATVTLDGRRLTPGLELAGGAILRAIGELRRMSGESR